MGEEKKHKVYFEPVDIEAGEQEAVLDSSGNIARRVRHRASILWSHGRKSGGNRQSRALLRGNSSRGKEIDN